MKRIKQKAMQTKRAAKPKGNMQLFGCFFVKLEFIALLHRRGSAPASPSGRGAPVRTLGRRGPSQSKIKDF